MKVGIIPARFASTRFPGKPLALIFGKPMIQHVYERAVEANLDVVVVATDDERIKNCVEDFGGKIVITSNQHQSGTDRCAEAARTLNLTENDLVINIQGDEPFIRKEEINLLISMFINKEICISTLAKQITEIDEIENINKVKVVFSKSMRALYFSRLPIPFNRKDNSKFKIHNYYKHIGIYGYKNETLQQITKLEISTLEEIEKLEQLRWLENDFQIHVQVCDYESIAIDTPEDLNQISNFQL